MQYCVEHWLYAGFYAETCQSSGGSGRRSWQGNSQRRRAAAKKAGQNAYATVHTELLNYYEMIMRGL